MKTKAIYVIAILAMGLFTVSCTQGEKKQQADATENEPKTMGIPDVTIDPAMSLVSWKGTMLGVYSHTGTLDFTQAELMLNEGEITGGKFTIDMNSMVATDENYNPEEGSTPEKLIGHLKADDFFAVEAYPTASFEITSVEENSLKGMLTIRDKTNEETVKNISMMKEGDKVMITGDMTFDRKKYDVSWDSQMKDMVLSDDIELTIQLSGK